MAVRSANKTKRSFIRANNPDIYIKIFELVTYLTNLVKAHYSVRCYDCYVSTFFTQAVIIIILQFERIVDERIVEVPDEIYANKVWMKYIFFRCALQEKRFWCLETNDHFFVQILLALQCIQHYNIKCRWVLLRLVSFIYFWHCMSYKYKWRPLYFIQNNYYWDKWNRIMGNMLV